MKDLSEFENALTKLRVSLIVELSSMAVHNSATDDWEIKTDGASLEEADESLLADASEEADTNVATLAELENQYQHVQIALGKIKLGTYGICEISGGVIDTERLHANPVARTCRAHMNEEAQLPL